MTSLADFARCLSDDDLETTVHVVEVMWESRYKEPE